jgi:hypothetical protein
MSTRRHLRIFLFTLLLIVCHSARAQVTSIFLSHMAGPWIASWEEENREIFFDVVVPSHSETLTIDYRVYGGTAEDGRDFIATSGTLTFQPTDWTKRIVVQLLDDAQFETDEIFFVQLTNATPSYPISTPVSAVTIRDDEVGFGADPATAKEDAGFVDVVVGRRGDALPASSVEVYLEPATALPGVEYVDQTFTIDFLPAQRIATVRISLLNDTIEDGDKLFYVRLRNATGGMPISSYSAGVFIEDNELGYAFRRAGGEADIAVYEGGPEKLILERLGDYDTASVVNVAITTSNSKYPLAEDGKDFVAAEFQVQFAPGQTSAEVPLVIFNDAIPEATEWARIQYATNITSVGIKEESLAIRDNEFNPLPVEALCPGIFAPMVSLTALSDGKFFVATGDAIDSTYTLTRFERSGAVDPTFSSLVLDGFVSQVVERADGKYVIGINRWHLGEHWIERLLADGATDESFSPAIAGAHSVTPDGKIYVTAPFRRLNEDGSQDASFTPPATSVEHVVLDAAGNAYIRQSDWVRLTATGSVDPTFALSGDNLLMEINGTIFRSGLDFHRLTSTGSDDPAFTSIPAAGVAAVEAGSDGRLYVFKSDGGPIYMERYNANGTPDPSYMRATVDISPSKFWNHYVMTKDRRAMLYFNGSFPVDDSINGVRMRCGDGSLAIARIELDVPRQRVALQPGTDVLWEGLTGQTVTVIRTGDNSTPVHLQYRVRGGTALPGVHYTLATDGELVFPAGASRALVPITIHDNTKPELDRRLFVDVLDEAGAVISTSKLTIRNEDVGLEVLAIEGETMHLLPISGARPKFILFRSSDMVIWEYFTTATGGMPITVDISDEARFFKGYAYLY